MVKNEALPAERIKAVETGGCPHAAIREVSKNFSVIMVESYFLKVTLNLSKFNVIHCYLIKSIIDMLLCILICCCRTQMCLKDEFNMTIII